MKQHQHAFKFCFNYIYHYVLCLTILASIGIKQVYDIAHCKMQCDSAPCQIYYEKLVEKIYKVTGAHFL